MGWFGPGQDEAWRQLGRALGAECVEDGFGSVRRVQSRVAPWNITLDTDCSLITSTTYTRMRAPYLARDGLRFTVDRRGLLSGLERLLGWQRHIEVGDPRFDGAFTLRGNDATKVRDLFSDPRLRALLREQPTIRLEVRDDDGPFGPRFPEGVDELFFREPGVITDVARLMGLFDLFAETLAGLHRIGSAFQVKPLVVL
jgi:hypothetical protein